MLRKLCILLLIPILLLSGCSGAKDGESGEISADSETIMGLEELEGPDDVYDTIDLEEDDDKKDTDIYSSLENDIDKNEQNTEDKAVESSSYIQKPVPEVILKDDINSGITVTLYYQNADAMIMPVSREIPRQEGIARAAVSGLIDSPLCREELDYYKLYPVLPAGTEILGLTIRDGIATIDFNDNILNYNSIRDEINIFSSIVYTLTEFDTIDNVIIWVNGYQDIDLKFDSDISGHLNRENIMINGDKLNSSDEDSI